MLIHERDSINKSASFKTKHNPFYFSYNNYFHHFSCSHMQNGRSSLMIKKILIVFIVSATKKPSNVIFEKNL